MHSDEPRSYCPINLSLEIFEGLVDLARAARHDVRGETALPRAPAVRLNGSRRTSWPIASRGSSRTACSRRRTIPRTSRRRSTRLTEKAITLLPIIVQIGAWGSRWVPDAKKLDARSRKVRTRDPGGRAPRLGGTNGRAASAALALDPADAGDERDRRARDDTKPRLIQPKTAVDSRVRLRRRKKPAGSASGTFRGRRCPVTSAASAARRRIRVNHVSSRLGRADPPIRRAT